MDASTAYDKVLEEARAAYLANRGMTDFAPFPSDVVRQNIHPLPLPCGDVFAREQNLRATTHQRLQDALFAAGPHAHWRATYKDTDIGDDFMNRFGCYAIIGPGGPFTSEHLRLWMVFMPADLDYTWHHHPAEEIYLVVAGSAVFRRKGAKDKVLREGDTSFHQSNQSHAMTTRASPILCLVAWRNAFETPPVLS